MRSCRERVMKGEGEGKRREKGRDKRFENRERREKLTCVLVRELVRAFSLCLGTELLIMIIY